MENGFFILNREACAWAVVYVNELLVIDSIRKQIQVSYQIHLYMMNNFWIVIGHNSTPLEPQDSIYKNMIISLKKEKRIQAWVLIQGQPTMLENNSNIQIKLNVLHLPCFPYLKY
jgi:hypothetical protein